MTDRVKVIMGLECLITNKVDCDGCQYNEGENSSCLRNIANDALELLKEQEPVPLNITQSVDGIYCSCGNCGLRIFGFKYCPNCGRKVKWDD